MIIFLLWCVLFVLCWPVALIALYPLVWLFLLPFRLVGIAVCTARLPSSEPLSCFRRGS